jgi:salicylate hydroxylase
MRDPRTVVIAGAGIGGLTAALTLAREGFRVAVAERTHTLSPIGAGIQLSPNAGRILAELGLDAALAPLAVEPAAIEIRSGHNGRVIAAIPLGERARKRYGFPYRTIHRADLQSVLLAAVSDHAEIDLQLGAELVEFAAHARGLTAMLQHGDGSANDLPAAALVGADGIRSRIRAVMPGARPLQPARRTAWRAVVDIVDAPPEMAHDRVGLWLAPDVHLVHYPIRAGMQVNIVAIVKEDLADESWNAPGERSAIIERFRRWCEPARQIIATPAEWTRWSIASVDPRGTWAAGPVALLGDAAHAMVPFLAQGGAMAIEDAAVLARALGASPDDAAAAFRRYQALRQPRLRRVWRTSASTGDLYHMGSLTGGIRNLGMRLIGGKGLLARYDWLYKWTPG